MKFKGLTKGQKFYFANDAEKKQFTVSEVSDTAIHYSSFSNSFGVGIRADNEEFVNRDVVLVISDGAGNTPLTKIEEFEKAAMPLMKYLALNHHPHMSVIVTSTNAELLEGQMTVIRTEA